MEGGQGVARFHRSTDQSRTLLDEIFVPTKVTQGETGLLTCPIRVHVETLLAGEADRHCTEPLVVAGKTLASFRPADGASLQKEQAPADRGVEIPNRLVLPGTCVPTQGTEDEK
jgi:hypothetical protein